MTEKPQAPGSRSYGWATVSDRFEIFFIDESGRKHYFTHVAGKPDRLWKIMREKGDCNEPPPAEER